ncbi:MAG TPA: hypothetical protein VF316_19590 [Polyangiaceae bacterium]
MLVLRSQRVVTGGEVRPASIHVEDGRIARLGAFEDAPGPVEDFGNEGLMAGLVDAPVHVDEPGRTKAQGRLIQKKDA